MNPYFIVGLPRTRTAWLSILLSSGPSICHHEALLRCEPSSPIFDLRAILSNVPHPHKYVGDSDSGLPLYFPKLKQTWPSAKYVLVERPFTEAFKSHRRAFPCFKSEKVRQAFDLIAQGLEVMKPATDNIVVNYDQLNDPMICKYIWDFCTDNSPFDVERCERLQQLRVNQIYSKVIEYAHPGFVANLKARHA